MVNGALSLLSLSTDVPRAGIVCVYHTERERTICPEDRAVVVNAAPSLAADRLTNRGAHFFPRTRKTTTAVKLITQIERRAREFTFKRPVPFCRTTRER